MSRTPWLPVCLGALLGMACVSTQAQQANARAPFRSGNDGFFEQIGSGWALNGPGWFFRFGGGPVAPPFGGAQPGAGAGGGVGIGGGGLNGNGAFMASQGSHRSNVSQSGNLTLFNGHPGYVSDASQSPFVMGLIPVVGQGKAPWRQQLDGDIPKQAFDSLKPLDEQPAKRDAAREAETWPQSDPGLRSVAEIQRQRQLEAASREQQVLMLLGKAREAVAAGKANVARIYYRMAERQAEGELKQQLSTELRDLEVVR